MTRDWSPEEFALIEQTPRAWPRSAKLTVEQVKAIRLRVDSLTHPWTLQELANEFGVDPQEIALIARREQWNDRAYEPKDFRRDGE